MKLKKIIITAMTTLTICVSTSQIASAANYSFVLDSSGEKEKSLYNISDIVNSDKKQITSTLAEDWKTNEKEIDYPIKPESDEWEKLDTHEKMVEACTIPDEIIQKMSTKELLEMVMDYPLISDLYYYDTYEQGLYALVLESNGLRELLKRDDGISEILEYYEKYEIPENAATSKEVLDELEDVGDDELDKKLTEILENGEKSKALQVDFRTIANIELVEIMLVNDIISVSCNEEQKSKIADIAIEKYNDKMQSNLFTGKENLICEAADEVGNINIIDEIVKEDRDSAVGYATTYVTTPNGSKVEVFTSSYNGEQWANNFDAETKRLYPDATLIRSSDNRYNCHSYAWYKQSIGNIYWMNNPAKYISDGSYQKITNKNNRGADNRVVWIQDNSYIHSGYLVSINNNGSYNIRSKWGAGPLMLHKASYSPYDGTREYYKR